MSATGALIVGVSGRYEFEIHHEDGRITRVIRDVEPVEVLEIEADWHRKFVDGGFGWTEGGERVPLVWDEEIPSSKPAFRRFIPTASGELWVLRDGPSDAIPGCAVGPIARSGPDRVPPRCHRTTRIVDVFELDGTYLGEIDVPAEIILTSPVPFIRDDLAWALEVDEAGVSRVKRFRIVTIGS